MYSVSDMGQVKNNITGKILKPTICKWGYHRVRLSFNGKQKALTVNRLVLETFIGMNDCMEVDHLNRDKSDNRLCNLEYVTHSENAKRWRKVEKKRKMDSV